MLNTLFNPKGAISDNRYWLACAILLAAYWLIIGLLFLDTFYLTKANYMAFGISTVMLLSYPYFCVYGKRLQSLDVKRFWLIPIFLLYILALYLTSKTLYAFGLLDYAVTTRQIFWPAIIYFSGGTAITISFDLALGLARRPRTGFGGAAAV